MNKFDPDEEEQAEPYTPSKSEPERRTSTRVRISTQATHYKDMFLEMDNLSDNDSDSEEVGKEMSTNSLETGITETDDAETAKTKTHTVVTTKKLNCLICHKPFTHTKAFSVRNQFSPVYCSKVWKIFCRLLNISIGRSSEGHERLIWNFQFDQFPLPFCTTCSGNVIGLTKLQEELDGLQESVSFAVNDIRKQIQDTGEGLTGKNARSSAAAATSQDDDPYQMYDSTLEDMRLCALRDFVPQLETDSESRNGKPQSTRKKSLSEQSEARSRPSKKRGRTKNTDKSKLGNVPIPIIKLEPISFDEMGSSKKSRLGKDVRKRSRSGKTETKDASGDADWVNGDPIRDSVDYDDFEGDTKKVQRHKNKKACKPQKTKKKETAKTAHHPDDPESNDMNDSKVTALIKDLSLRTRRNILKKRQALKKAEKPFVIPLITTADGRLLYDNVEIHKDDIDGLIKYRCNLCGSRQKLLGAIKRHIRSAHQNGLLKEHGCTICGKSLRNIGSLPRHISIYHSDKERRLYECDFCGKTLKSERSIKSHKALVHSFGLDHFYVCEICARPFRDEKTMKAHGLSHMNEMERHMALMEDKPGIILFQCSFCGKALSTEAALKGHEMIHTGATPFVCDICGWGFRHKCNLQAHLEIHQGEERTFSHACDFPDCTKKYSTRLQLVHHSYSHRPIEEKPYKCSYCGTGFVRSSDLNVHRRKHTGEKPYTCVICLKAFSRSYHLTRHCKNVHHVTHDETATIITADILDPNLLNIEFTVTTTEIKSLPAEFEVEEVQF